jgi:hypothetical protein
MSAPAGDPKERGSGGGVVLRIALLGGGVLIRVLPVFKLPAIFGLDS